MKTSKLPLVIAGTLGLGACGVQTSELPEDSVIKGVGWVGATVSDLDQTTKLYEDAMDLKQVDDSVIEQNANFDQLTGRTDVEAQTRMMRSVNAQVRFMSFASPSKEAKNTPHMAVQGPGIMHVCYQVDQETQAYQKFLTGGAQFMGEKEMQQLNPKNPVYYSYSRDFDGLIAEIEHVDVTQLDLPQPPKNKYRIRHVALATPDIDRLSDFYAKFLGQPKFRRFGQWPFLRMEGEKSDKVSGLEGTSGEAAWFQIRNLELEMFQFHSHPTEDRAAPRPIDANGYNMIVFDVSDMDAARELLVKAGGTIETEPTPMDGGQIMFGRDPDGNLLGLQTAPTDSFVSSRNFKNNGIE
ncbi:hypothetical protein GCM10009096_02420 [Parasphingorhabdus litoris]|uniref:VOC domain-containing protein n=1 Tax=Parasphingorhabdus litoris TaxID=394733 RepID=A0ABN1A1M6_9SPHN|nr:VOC family protein [Parasphingorhabdus litoris]